MLLVARYSDWLNLFICVARVSADVGATGLARTPTMPVDRCTWAKLEAVKLVVTIPGIAPTCANVFVLLFWDETPMTPVACNSESATVPTR